MESINPFYECRIALLNPASSCIVCVFLSLTGALREDVVTLLRAQAQGLARTLSLIHI